MKLPLIRQISNLENYFLEINFLPNTIIDIATSKDKSTLWVLCKSEEVDALKPCSLAQVTHENNSHVDTSLGSFFRKESSEKQFILAHGIEWDGKNTFEDFI